VKFHVAGTPQPQPYRGPSMETIHGKMIIITSTMIAQTMGIAHRGSFISRFPFIGRSSGVVAAQLLIMCLCITAGALRRAVWRYQQFNFGFAPNGMERPQPISSIASTEPYLRLRQRCASGANKGSARPDFVGTRSRPPEADGS